MKEIVLHSGAEVVEEALGRLWTVNCELGRAVRCSLKWTHESENENSPSSLATIELAQTTEES